MKRITRRQFHQMLALGTAPLFVPAAALGNQQRAAPSDRITIGVIGVGTQGRGLMGGFLGMKDVQVLAVCDVDTNRREFARKMVDERYAAQVKSGEYKGCAAYNDFRDLLARKDIDAVVIATPDHWHAIPVLEACKAGKDIYCEKPLSLTIHEARLMIEAVRKYNRVFQTGSQQRSSREFWVACGLVRAGRIGQLKEVHVNVGGPSRPCDLPEEPLEPGLDWDRWLGPAPKRPYNSVLSPRGVHNHFPAWRNYKEYSGGMMTDWGAHHFDIAQWGIGADDSGPVEILPPPVPWPKTDKGVRFVYANGVVVVHSNEYAPGKPVNGVAFLGSDGRIFVNRGYLASDPPDLIKQPDIEKIISLPRSTNHLRNWIECIKTRQRPICDVEIGARSVTVCHLGNLAYWNHRKLRWNPKTWQFEGDSEANGWLDRPRRDPYQLPIV